jgi:hypothetical protein
MSKIKFFSILIILLVGIFAMNLDPARAVDTGKTLPDRNMQIQASGPDAALSCSCGALAEQQFYRGRRGELGFIGGQCLVNTR